MRKAFRDAVFEVVRSIPKGRALSYTEVSKRAGFPGAARAVGTLMRKNRDPAIPCHRVIRSDGRPGNYNRGGEEAKCRKLKQEGVRFDMKGRRAL